MKENKKANIEELNKMVETHQKQQEPNYLGGGIIAGFCLGMILAIVLNNLSLGIGIGMCIGIAGAIVFAYKNVKIDDEQPATENEVKEERTEE